MSSIDRYKIRDKAQKPQRVHLIDPATGEKTQDWLDVRSSLSDEFLSARDEAMQDAAGIRAEPNLDKRKELVKEQQVQMKASLVAGWSFDTPFTKENVVDLLRNAPQIQQMLVSVADDSASFFGKASETLSSGRGKK